jgi:hypothetical protein
MSFHESSSSALFPAFSASAAAGRCAGRRVALACAPALAEGIEPSSKWADGLCADLLRDSARQCRRPRAETDNTLMSVLVSVRNTDPLNSIRVVARPYYNTEGVLISQLAARHRGSFRRSAPSSCSSNSARIWWFGCQLCDQVGRRRTPVSQPTIEALHSTFQAGYSVAFISRGRAISEP